MNTCLAVSAALLTLLALAHTVVGEWLILMPLDKLRSDLPRLGGSMLLTRRTLRFAWHLTTLLGVGVAAILFHHAQLPAFDADQQFVLHALALTCAACGTLSLVGSRGRHPSWIVFAAVAALIWLGAM